jgi:hypothetical protein
MITFARVVVDISVQNVTQKKKLMHLRENVIESSATSAKDQKEKFLMLLLLLESED